MCSGRPRDQGAGSESGQAEGWGRWTGAMRQGVREIGRSEEADSESTFGKARVSRLREKRCRVPC